MKKITGSLQTKNGRYYALLNLYDENGKRKVKWVSLKIDATKRNLREATLKLEEILDEYNKVACKEEAYETEQKVIERTEDPKILERIKENERLASIPFTEYMLCWCNQRKDKLQPTTYCNYIKQINGRINTYFNVMNDYTLKDIDGDVLNDFYGWIMQDCCARTALHYHTELSTAFEYAIKRGIIASNPCLEADRPKAEKTQAEYYNAEEIKNLLTLTEEDPLHLSILIAAKCGLRRSEVLGLRWSAIDFENKIIHINHKVEEIYEDGKLRYQGSDKLKSEASRREIPLIPSIEDALIKEKQMQEYRKKMFKDAYGNEEGYICVDYRGKLIRPNYVTQHFEQIVKKNNLRDLTFHGLRHSCATILLGEGVGMKVIQEILGHSTFSTTADIYSHVDFSSKRAAGAIMELATT